MKRKEKLLLIDESEAFHGKKITAEPVEESKYIKCQEHERVVLNMCNDEEASAHDKLSDGEGEGKEQSNQMKELK